MAIDASTIGIAIIILIIAIFFARGIRVIRPTQKAAIERLGRFQRIKDSGITWIVPFIDRSYIVNITEQLTEAERQEIITKDNLNATVSAQVYFRVRGDDQSVKDALYKVNDYRAQIVALARTTMRNVIGDKDFATVNSRRGELNADIMGQIQQQVRNWGIDIVRVEVKEIDPPKEVQETMNAVIQANNKKVAAKDLAEAAATTADGERQAAIKKAEGQKQSEILEAEGRASATKTIAEAEASKIRTIASAEAEKIKVINEAARDYFRDNAIELKRLETMQEAMKNNSKYVIVEKGTNPTLVLEGSNGAEPIVPMKPTAKVIT
ncbi:MAG: SPFH domain-containing protein [Nitrososphaera sp.]|jgi:regulator of protease activity HflC (stomatin/prohibitin superfamily)